MKLVIHKPELERFIADEVATGHYPSREAVLEAAVAQMKLDRESCELSEDDRAAIEESEKQIEAGEAVDFDEFAAEMRSKYCAK